MSDATQDRSDEADEKAAKPGEQDTETVAGQPEGARVEGRRPIEAGRVVG